jgi:hypothetical protein
MNHQVPFLLGKSEVFPPVSAVKFEISSTVLVQILMFAKFPQDWWVFPVNPKSHQHFLQREALHSKLVYKTITLWLFNIAMENGWKWPIEIDGLPIKNGGSFHGELLVITIW